MDIKVPEVGESVFEAEVGKWHKKDGEQVAKDDLLVELETDKITLELNADAEGVLRIGVKEGETVKIGAVIGSIEEAAGGKEEGEAAAKEPKKEKEEPKPEKKEAEKKKEEKKPAAEEKPKERPAEKKPEAKPEQPVAAEEKKKAAAAPAPRPREKGEEERITRQPMSRIRRRIAERLVAARQQTAMLTTFNEADMSRVIALRQKHGEEFKQRHGVPLGFMSFFVKASAEALKEFPEVNARIDGDDIVHQHFYDIGIAVGAEKGLVVPVIRDADRLSFAGIEQAIRDFVGKIEQNKLDLADLEGGTFSITNGGVYGSLLSTPILNPPQSAILGMHAIQERPVVRDGEIVIRPMMYLALSYDHRIVDGKGAVTFLVRVKEALEDPRRLLMDL
ncbi:MAG TPA: 2-oxoglutarate dehydrogenase complex dihydrolipoyllysine-residue succinyltransferase [Desulfuromonadales bacterium]